MNYQINTEKGTIDLSSFTGIVAESSVENTTRVFGYGHVNQGSGRTNVSSENIRTLNFWLKGDSNKEMNCKINGDVDLRIGQRITFLWSQNGTKIVFNHNTSRWNYSGTDYGVLHAEKLLNKKKIRFSSYLILIFILSLSVALVSILIPFFIILGPIYLFILTPIFGPKLATKRLNKKASNLFETQIRNEVNKITQELEKL